MPTEILDQLKLGNLIVKCPVMTLKPMVEDGRPTVSGAGHIKQNATTGELAFEMMLPSPVSILDIKKQNEVPGQLAGEAHFYKLSVEDLGGDIWEAEEVLPDFPLLPGRIITGRLFEISQHSAMPRCPASKISLYFRGHFTIPCYTTKETSTTIEGREIESSSSRCIARFAFHDYQFYIETGDKLLRVEIANSTSSFPPYFEERVTEALEFVLGRQLDWIAFEKIENEQGVCTIRGGLSTLPKGCIGPPLNYSSYDSTGDFWILFKLYLDNIYIHRLQERPTLSRAVRFVRKSASTYLDFQEFAISSSIEGILINEYSGIMEETDEAKKLELKKKFDDAKDKILSLDIDETLNKRIQGAIGAMEKIGPGDIMPKLIEAGTVSKEDYDAWKKFRHRVAHAGECEFDQKRISLANRVLALFYRLIFDKIGYTGHYTDYGSEGFPTKLLREPTVELGG